MVSNKSAIIVDDEATSRSVIRNFVTKYCKQIEIIGEAENIIQAKDLIDKKNPQLVFLDIEMPRGNAFDLLEQFNEIHFHVIFITAFSQYAIQAFNIANAHYLLKPLEIDALIKSVDEVCNIIDLKEQSNFTQILLENLKDKQKSKVVIPLIDGFEVIQTNLIVWIQADDNFSVFHLENGQKVMACRKLKYYEQNLSSLGFFRIHRSSMVNLDRVKKYYKGKTAYIIMDNDTRLDIAASRKANFKSQFKI